MPATSAAQQADRTGATPVRCGIAGWSFPDWKGTVYPAGTRDELRYIAQYVDVIEINSSFYHAPQPQHVESWLRRTADLPDLLFTAKLPQDVTHARRLDPDLRAIFLDAFEPMVEAGRLPHLLAQFKYDFEDEPAARDHLRGIRRAYGGLTTLTYELRHRSWQSEDALTFLRGLDVSVAHLDYPLASNSFDLRHTQVGEHAYLRLHGRNAPAWFSSGADRSKAYDYLYSRKELEDISARACEIASLSKSLTLIANNHYRGKEAANALELKAMLENRKVAVPPALLSHYPRLAEISDRLAD